MQKMDRQNTLLNVISARRIGNQDELVRLLRKNGFSVTQASVSRDLVELGVVKASGYYSLPEKPKNGSAFGLDAMEKSGENLIVAKCAAGLASAAAVRIDAAHISEIIGTIAGDDTIFIAVNDVQAQKSVLEKLRKLFDE